MSIHAMSIQWFAAPAACLSMALTIAPPASAQEQPKTVSDASSPAPAVAELASRTPERRSAATASVPLLASTTVVPQLVDTTKDYRIGPEDVLDILVWKQENLSRTVPVRPDGKVSLPLVNDIQAAGLTPTELRTRLTDRLTEYVSAPEVSVIVKEVHSVKVSVLGAVRMPGHYEVKSPSTVLDLIARAQGLTEFADRARIVVLRQVGGATTRVPFNYRKVAEGAEQDNFPVLPGDIIVVP